MNAFRLLSIAACLLATLAVPSQGNHKDVVKSTHTIKGRFVGFEVGDYVHAIIKHAKGKERSFFIGTPGLDYYLASFPNKSGTFTMQIVDSYIEQAGGRMVIERLSRAKIGKVESSVWWKSQLKKSSMEKLDKKYQPLVDKLTRKGN